MNVTTYNVDGQRFARTRHGRWIDVFRWCDCVHGPHWHPLGSTNQGVRAAECMMREAIQ